MTKLATTAILSALLFAAAPAAFAADVGQHPAIFVSRSLPSIDTNTFLVGHPAGGRAGQAVAARSNFEHPAVVMHRAGQVAHIDPNTFIVQPPAATVWVAPSTVLVALKAD